MIDAIASHQLFPEPLESQDSLNLATPTTANETPLFICFIPDCFRLFPDRSKLVAHRTKEHGKTAADSEGAALWQNNEAFSWDSVKSLDDKPIPQIVEEEIDIWSSLGGEFETKPVPKPPASALPLAQPTPLKPVETANVAAIHSTAADAPATLEIELDSPSSSEMEVDYSIDDLEPADIDYTPQTSSVPIAVAPESLAERTPASEPPEPVLTMQQEEEDWSIPGLSFS